MENKFPKERIDLSRLIFEIEKLWRYEFELRNRKAHRLSFDLDNEKPRRDVPPLPIISSSPFAWSNEPLWLVSLRHREKLYAARQSTIQRPYFLLSAESRHSYRLIYVFVRYSLTASLWDPIKLPPLYGHICIYLYRTNYLRPRFSVTNETSTLWNFALRTSSISFARTTHPVRFSFNNRLVNVIFSSGLFVFFPTIVRPWSLTY